MTASVLLPAHPPPPEKNGPPSNTQTFGRTRVRAPSCMAPDLVPTAQVGSVLCNACYKRFKDRGTLEKHHRGAGSNSASNAGANNPTTPKKQAAQALAGLAAAAAAAAQEDTKGKTKQAAKPAASPTASPAKAQAVPAASPAKDAAPAAAPAAAAATATAVQAKTVDLGKQKVTVTVKPVVAKGKAAGKAEAANPSEGERISRNTCPLSCLAFTPFFSSTALSLSHASPRSLSSLFLLPSLLALSCFLSPLSLTFSLLTFHSHSPPRTHSATATIRVAEQWRAAAASKAPAAGAKVGKATTSKAGGAGGASGKAAAAGTKRTAASLEAEGRDALAAAAAAAGATGKGKRAKRGAAGGEGPAGQSKDITECVVM